MIKKELSAYIGLILMTIIVGFSFIFVKIALKTASPVDLLAHRFSFAVIPLFFYYIVVRRRRPEIRREHLLPLLFLVIFYPLLLFWLQTVGLKYTTASEAGIISALAPVLTLLLAAMVLKEKNSLLQIGFVLLSVGGVIFIFYKTGVQAITAESFKGNIFILLSVISMAFYFVFARRLSNRLNSMDITFFMTVTAAIVFNVVAIYRHAATGTLYQYFNVFHEPTFLLAILYLGILSSFLTSFLINNALTVIPASQVSIFNNFSPIITVFAGILFLDEKLQTYHIIGGMMVLIGIIGVNLPGKKEVVPANSKGV